MSRFNDKASKSTTEASALPSAHASSLRPQNTTTVPPAAPKSDSPNLGPRQQHIQTQAVFGTASSLSNYPSSNNTSHTDTPKFVLTRPDNNKPLPSVQPAVAKRDNHDSPACLHQGVQPPPSQVARAPGLSSPKPDSRPSIHLRHKRSTSDPDFNEQLDLPHYYTDRSDHGTSNPEHPPSTPLERSKASESSENSDTYEATHKKTARRVQEIIQHEDTATFLARHFSLSLRLYYKLVGKEQNKLPTNESAARVVLVVRNPLKPSPPSGPLHSPVFHIVTNYSTYAKMLLRLQELAYQIDQCQEGSRIVVWTQMFSVVGCNIHVTSQKFSSIVETWISSDNINLLAVELLFVSFHLAQMLRPSLMLKEDHELSSEDPKGRKATPRSSTRKNPIGVKCENMESDHTMDETQAGNLSPMDIGAALNSIDSSHGYLSSNSSPRSSGSWSPSSVSTLSLSSSSPGPSPRSSTSSLSPVPSPRSTLSPPYPTFTKKPARAGDISPTTSISLSPLSLTPVLSAQHIAINTVPQFSIHNGPSVPNTSTQTQSSIPEPRLRVPTASVPPPHSKPSANAFLAVRSPSPFAFRSPDNGAPFLIPVPTTSTTPPMERANVKPVPFRVNTEAAAPHSPPFTVRTPQLANASSRPNPPSFNKPIGPTASQPQSTVTQSLASIAPSTHRIDLTKMVSDKTELKKKQEIPAGDSKKVMNINYVMS